MEEAVMHITSSIMMITSTSKGSVINGDCTWITSLQTEQMTQLGALYTLHGIAATSVVEHLLSHSDMTIKRAGKKSSVYADTSPLATDYYVWAEIARVYEQFPNLTAEEPWVKCHQDAEKKDITTDMDALASHLKKCQHLYS